MGSFLHEGDITEQSAGTPAAGRSPESSLIRRIAVCVCTACRPGSLLRLLTLLEHAEAPAGATEMLLVVIDNRPGGETPEILARAAPRLPFRTILEAEPTPGISFARNRAVVVALECGADFVAFIDDDDLPRSDWLVRLLETQECTGADMIFGSHRPSPNMPVPFGLERTGLFKKKPLPGLNTFGVPAGASTCNVLLCRELLLDLLRDGPPFRAEFARTGGGDTDLFIRAVRRNFTYAVSRESEVWLGWEPERLTWIGLTRRSFRYGVSRRLLLEIYGKPVPRLKELRRTLSSLLVTGVRTTGAIHRRRRFARRYFSFVSQLGEAYSMLGGTYEYYSGGYPPAMKPGQER